MRFKSEIRHQYHLLIAKFTCVWYVFCDMGKPDKGLFQPIPEAGLLSMPSGALTVIDLVCIFSVKLLEVGWVNFIQAKMWLLLTCFRVGSYSDERYRGGLGIGDYITVQFVSILEFRRECPFHNRLLTVYMIGILTNVWEITLVGAKLTKSFKKWDDNVIQYQTCSVKNWIR